MKADQSGIGDDLNCFRRLQADFANQYRAVFPDPAKPRTVLVIPSLSLDSGVLSKISGVHHYEERLLCLLHLLRMPRTRVIYLSSEPISEAIIDYFLHLLPGTPHRHARDRLVMLSCHDASSRPLTAKILDRPRLLDRIALAISDRASTHMICFNVSRLEQRLAVELGIPIYGCDPAHLHFGTKSGSRKLFRKANIMMPAGFEDLADEKQLGEAAERLKRENPGVTKAVVKLNDGFSGEGNAILEFPHDPTHGFNAAACSRMLPDMRFEAEGMDWEAYREKIGEMGCIIEAFLDGSEKRSPSSQYRIDPLGGIETISTHDQILGGNGQVFLGCCFPADPEYVLDIQQEGLKVAELLRDAGVLGRFGVDFISLREKTGWSHYAIEVNLRKGGTTHPYTMLQYLTDGSYDAKTGQFHTIDGRVRCYYATDNLESKHYRGLTPEDLIDIAVRNEIHFYGATQRGVVFHLISALSQFGKVGAVCIAENREAARDLYQQTVDTLDRECVSSHSAL